jgi:predicted Na+-dependent transporter
MKAVMQVLQDTFSPLVLLFTVSNPATMGLQVRMPEVMATLRNKKSLALIFVWGWVLGPAFGYRITRVLPLTEPYVIVVLLASLAPCAPFLQQTVGKARGDRGFAGALIPLVAIGAVVLMPVMALGMGTRNVAAVLAAALAIPNADPRIVVMVIMWTLWSVVLAAIGAKTFAKQAGQADSGGAA